MSSSNYPAKPDDLSLRSRRVVGNGVCERIKAMTISRVVVITSLWALVSCGQQRASHVEVRNDAGVPLTDVEIDVGGKKIQVGLIDSGHATKVAFDPVSDSGVRISYKEGHGSRAHSCVGDVYVTTGRDQHVVAIIGPSQICRLQEM